MGLWDTFTRWLDGPLEERSIDTFDPFSPLAVQLAAVQHGTPRPWRLPSIREALGVPAIQRAVTLIANTTGTLALQGYRNGVLMAETPRVMVRPDPFTTPHDFYRDAAFQMATRGETVFWIAARDSDGLAASLIVVPLAELTVEANTRNRLFPVYTWGSIRSTRYSPANPEGAFVHVTYLKEPMGLRGMGPLQLCGAASSVSVEAQEWAANFYAGGGYPSINLHSEVDLDATEAEALRDKWISTPANMPQVTSGPLKVTEVGANPQGAQMLEAREFQNGDAARMFGMPGKLLEYAAPGSSLTYQTITEVFTSFVQTCLVPNYLDPMEQALSDLLPRSQVVNFYVKGLLRADIKTRWEVYQAAVDVLGPKDAANLAREGEGLTPGSIENAPVPLAPPIAIPGPLQQRSREVRCDGQRVLHGRLMACGKLLSESGSFVGTCPRCKKAHSISEPLMERAIATILPTTLPVISPPVSVSIPVIEAIEPTPPDATIRDLIEALPVAFAAFAAAMPRQEAPVVNFHERALLVEVQPTQVTTGPVNVNVEAPAPAQVTISEGAVRVVENPPTRTVFDFDPETQLAIGYHEEPA